MLQNQPENDVTKPATSHPAQDELVEQTGEFEAEFTRFVKEFSELNVSYLHWLWKQRSFDKCVFFRRVDVLEYHVELIKQFQLFH